MYQRRVRSGRRNSYGIRSVRYDSYSTVNGMETKTGWWDIHRQVEKRSGGRCEAYVNGARCHGKGKDVHHITPLSSGGTTTMSNMIHLCEDCHDRRHSHMHRKRKV